MRADAQRLLWQAEEDTPEEDFDPEEYEELLIWRFFQLMGGLREDQPS